MMIKGQQEYPCIFPLENVVLRVRTGSGGAWLDANSHTVAKYDSKVRAGEVLQDIYSKIGMPSAGIKYTLPEA